MDDEIFPTRAADEEVELEHIVQACELSDEELEAEESEEGIRRFFQREREREFINSLAPIKVKDIRRLDARGDSNGPNSPEEPEIPYHLLDRSKERLRKLRGEDV